MSVTINIFLMTTTFNQKLIIIIYIGFVLNILKIVL